MAQDGLFSGLRFSDVILPLVGTAAASYSPYLARGLQTGMGLFNSLSNFQNSARYWKHLRSEREREDELIRAAQEGMNPIEAEILRRQGARMGELEQGVRDEDIVRFTQAQGGFPDAISPEIFERGVAGPPNLGQLTEQAASDDDLSNSLKLYEAQLAAYKSGLPLSPGASISGAGTLAQQLMGSDLDMRQIAETNKLWEEQSARQLANDAINRSENLKAIGEEVKIRGAADAEKRQRAIEQTRQMATIWDKALPEMDDQDLHQAINRYVANIAELKKWALQGDPEAAIGLSTAVEQLEALRAEMRRRTNKDPGTPPAGRNLRYVPGVGLVDENSTAPQPGQMIPGH